METQIWVNIGSGNAWRHQAITWTNIDLLSVRSFAIHIEEIALEMFMNH